MTDYFVLLSFFFIAAIYSSVGFGGGSSYIALLALMAYPYREIPILALTCNIVVVFTSSYFHLKEKKIEWQVVNPFIFFSIPLSYLGGVLEIEREAYLWVLSLSLIVAGMLLIFSKTPQMRKSHSPFMSFFLFSFIGIGLGFLSGLVGIGGGIFLAPLLLLMGLQEQEKVPATSSLFILFNSVAGLIGQFKKGDQIEDPSFFFFLLIIVVLGSVLGNKIQLHHLSKEKIMKITGVLVLIVSFRLMIGLIL